MSENETSNDNINKPMETATSPPNVIDQTPFVNPYADVDEVSGNRVQTVVSNTDYLLIKLIRPSQGTIRYVMNHLWSKLCTALRNIDITDVTKQNQFEQFVSNLIILDKDTYEQLLSDSTRWNEHLATTGLGRHTTTAASGSDRSNRGAVSKTARTNDGKRAKGVREAHSDHEGKRGDVQGRTE